ncbi:MAG: hypothetical protein M3O50_08660 [Myxococcota bacterium]|nr:hypothetical protein [Myxococcota bacterium]
MSRTNGSAPPRTATLGLGAAAAAGALLLLPLFGACADPKQDFDDWITRTADARASVYVAPDGAEFEGSSPDGGFSGEYFMSCLPSTGQGDVAQALLSKVTLRYTSDGSGGGTVDYEAIALRKDATDLSQSVGTPTVLKAIPVSGFVAALVYGPTTIPAAADPLTPIDIVFRDLTLYMHIENETQLCATLSGHVVQPQMIDLSQPGNYCVLRQSMSAIPKLQLSDFHCP